MRKLVALVDGSLYSHSVCDLAAWIARREEAAIEVLHVIGRRQAEGGAANLSGSIALGARTMLLKELSELDEQMAKVAATRGRAILEDASARLAEAGAGEVSTRLRTGDLVDTLEESEADAQAIVLGKRGEAADFARMHLGSNLERVVRSARKPVYVAARAFRPIKRVLIAFDGGPSSLKAVDHVARSKVFAGLDIQLLTVGADTDETRTRLRRAAETLAGGGHTAHIDVVAGQPETAIANVVEEQGIDLLVMGAYGHSRIRSLIIGSTTTEMVRSCKIPVLLLR
jgi:nucleotide-binding universal stress UspA family protein